MANFTFVHAADLHLGAPFRGLDAAASRTFARERGGLAGRGASFAVPAGLLTEAAFTALARLEELCLAEKAAFLLLSGDIYDDENGVLRARFALRDMFGRLAAAGVRVFVAHGNHDPLTGAPAPVSWPEGVTVFGPRVQTETVRRGGEVLALVHGVSHTGPREKNNLALQFGRAAPDLLTPAEGVFQIGVLHCCVGAAEGHAPYAPCSPADLARAGLDYWALGHVHQGRVLSEAPFAVYPGSLQGLHVNETGPHGCALVRVEGTRCRVRSVPLAPVVWHKLGLDLDAAERPCATVDDLEQAVLDALDDLARPDAAGAPGVEARLCRVILTGHTDLDRVLRRPGELETLLERLRGVLARTGADGPRIWLKDLVLRTNPARDFAGLTERDDLAGEVARTAARAVADEAALRELADAALADLYGHRRLKRVLAAPAGDGLRELAASARSLCCSLLESD